MFTLDLKKADLRAALHIAAKNDVRYYLNGIFVECSATQTRIVATDGHVLCAINCMAPVRFEGDAVQSLIIPRDVVAKIKKPTRRNDLSAVILEFDGKVGTLRIDGQDETFTPIDGRFPDWRRVFPSRVSGIAGQYDPELMVRFSKASAEYFKEAARATIPTIYHNLDAESLRASRAAVVSIGQPDFVGLVMPFHALEEFTPDPVPSWARHAVDFVPAEPETAEA